MTIALPETKESLWRLAAPPVIWFGHFLLSYCTAAIWCEKFAGEDGSLAPVRVAIAIYTLISLALVALVGWHGWRRHRHGDADLPHDDDTPADRHRFLGFATLLLAGLSAIAIVYEALPAALIGSCR